ncbi:SMI1/KNR4 family protein [Pseudomonas sp. LFS044]|uniref:SMI1/KNR4 family protein n=1 Tax=Pseudomonas sp. LFS044 TaxID=3229880 RepID=UPI003A8024B4
MTDFKLLHCGSRISGADIEALEAQIGINLPVRFRAIYQAYNGGSPVREFWISDEDFEPVRVEGFKSISSVGAQDANETKYIGGCYRRMRERNVIPSKLVPFANDEAGNFICLEKGAGRVIYFAVDTFQTDLDMYLNHINAQRVMSDSFGDFIDSLVGEVDVDF